jgi:hypothetical protein
MKQMLLVRISHPFLCGHVKKKKKKKNIYRELQSIYVRVETTYNYSMAPLVSLYMHIILFYFYERIYA